MGPHFPIALWGAGHPERTPSVADVMAKMAVKDSPAVTVLERRLAFEDRHPEVIIKCPVETRSGLWEADWPGKQDEYATHGDCAVLLDYLEARFDAGDLRPPDPE